MCIFDKNHLYQHVPGQDSSPQLRGPDNTASGPTARLAMSLMAADEVGQRTHFKTMTSLGMKRGEQSGSPFGGDRMILPLLTLELHYSYLPRGADKFAEVCPSFLSFFFFFFL